MDLDGDGKREWVSLQTFKEGQGPLKSGADWFVLSINGKRWPLRWLNHDRITDCSFIPQHHKGPRFLFVDTESEYEPTLRLTKIYRWQRGQLRQVSPPLEEVHGFNRDGTLTEHRGYQWITFSHVWRFNGRSILHKVKRPLGPIVSRSMVSGEGGSKISIQLNKYARFYRSPNWNSRTLAFPRGTLVTFDAIDDREWLRAKVGRRTLWIPVTVVEESIIAFNFPRAG